MVVEWQVVVETEPFGYGLLLMIQVNTNLSVRLFCMSIRKMSRQLFGILLAIFYSRLATMIKSSYLDVHWTKTNGSAWEKLQVIHQQFGHLYIITIFYLVLQMTRV